MSETSNRLIEGRVNGREDGTSALVIDGNEGWREIMACLRLSIAWLWSSCQIKSTFFLVRSTRGTAMDGKSLNQMRMVPAMPRNARTSVIDLHGARRPCVDLGCLESSGTIPASGTFLETERARATHLCDRVRMYPTRNACRSWD